MFQKEDIYLDVDVENYIELFEKMAKIFEEKGYVKETYLKSVLEREKKYPTGFEFDGYNIGLPHTDAEHISIQKIILIRLKNEIEYREVVTNKKIPIKIFIMLLIKNGEDQTTILGKLIEIIGEKEFYRKVSEAKKVEDLKELYE